MKKLTTSEFIINAQNIHGNKYNYSLVQYEGIHTNVKIVCPLHGIFEQRPMNHISHKRGCPLCGDITKLDKFHKWMRTTEQFISEAESIHGDKYDYSLCEYKNCYTHVKIICNIHGLFLKTPKEHVTKNKSGCSKCAQESSLGGYSEEFFKNHPDYKDRPAILYLIEGLDESVHFVKIGITRQDIQKRFKNFISKLSIAPIFLLNMTLHDAFKIEQRILSKFSKNKYYPRSTLKFDGKTECFYYSHDMVDNIRVFCANEINMMSSLERCK